MAHNALIRGGVASGLWTNHVITGTEMELFDQRQFESINGDQGGTWTPAAIIRIGGSFGLAIATHLVFDNSADVGFGTGVTINGSPTWSGTITWSAGGIAIGAISIGGGVLAAASTGIVSVATGASLLVAAGATATFSNDPTFAIGHTVTFNGTETINGNVNVQTGANVLMNVGSALLIYSTISMQNGTLSGSGTLSGFLTRGSTGRLRDLVVDGVNLDHTYSLADGNKILAPTLTAFRNYTITSTGAGEGDTMIVTVPVGGPFGVNLLRDNSSVIIQIAYGAGSTPWALLLFHGGQWNACCYAIM